MQYTLMLWHADHVNFGRLLPAGERVAAGARGRSVDHQLMPDIMYYMTHYSDALHQSQGGYRVGAHQVARRQRERDDKGVDDSTRSCARRAKR